MGVAFFLFGLAIAISVANVLFVWRGCHVAYMAGKISGLRRAVALAEEVAEDALHRSQAGELLSGMMQAHAAHDVALRIRSEIGKTK
jgi:hypothetical protein